ncbi:RNA methyltransferase [Paenibacillus macerans]|uniref:TRM11 family SAM-dependent methyltransferase n=1 Tax=Paenibacillus macerans TaxID=44252 RepID=UPI003D314BCD
MDREEVGSLNLNHPPERYVYPYACHENERELCLMELRALFGEDGEAARDRPYVDSRIRLAPNRSPFVSLRLDVLFEAATLEEICAGAAKIRLEGRTFKALYLKSGLKRTYEQQREMEREVGRHIRGKADMRRAEVTFGLLAREDGWLFGICRPSEPVWQAHKQKPNNYSTGLTTSVARALANIAVPDPAGRRVIDPCCGMGNVLIEALSMGIDIVGRDINPLAVRGARSNLRHFGYDDSALVAIGDLNDLDGVYDAAIVDMPYNLCSVLSPQERRRMLSSVRRIAGRAVIVSSEPLGRDIASAGWAIVDACTVSKGSFVRNIWLTHANKRTYIT